MYMATSAKDGTQNGRDWHLVVSEYPASTASDCTNLFNNPSVPMYNAQTDVVNPGPTTVN